MFKKSTGILPNLQKSFLYVQKHSVVVTTCAGIMCCIEDRQYDCVSIYKACL